MRAAFHTLGCKTNAYETQAIQEQFEAAGYEIADFAEECDVYVVNTCAVTHEAARKSRQMTGRCKKNNPDALIVMTGCYAQEAAQKIVEDGLADIVVGNSEKSKIISIVSNKIKEKGQSGASQNASDFSTDESGILVDDLTHCTTYENQNITSQGSHVRAYVKIQDGCNRFCSYCLIPFLRGRSRSRYLSEIIDEVKTLAAAGYQEIVLTGIDISSFEIHEADEDAIGLKTSDEPAMYILMKKISEIPGIRRIRLGSLEAGIASEEMIEKLSSIKQFCPQFHLSLQSGCDSVLKRMNRHYTTEEFVGCVETIRRYFPAAGITTDVITGFPGETDEEFAQTVEYVKKIAFSRMHVFPYSRRKKTRADQLPDQLPKAVKEARARELIAVGEELRKEYESRLIGCKCEILVEEIIEDSATGRAYFAGYTPEYVRILADADIYGRNVEPLNQMVNQMLTVVPTEFADDILYCR